MSPTKSVKYKQLQRQQIQNLKQVQEEERGYGAGHSRKFQHETTKRRKQLAIRRKLEQAKEERRRQEILARRREEIKSVTERFQRLNKNYTPKSEAEIRANLAANKTPVHLEDALRAVRGSPQPTQHYTHHQPSYHQYNGRSSPPNPNQALVGQDQGGNKNNGYYHHTQEQNGGSYHYSRSNSNPLVNSNLSIGRVPSATGRTQGSSGSLTSKQYPAGTAVNNKNSNVQDHSLRNVTNSRSLFEQKLVNQQQINLQQQQVSLHQFNQALQTELSTAHDENFRPNSDVNALKHDSLSSAPTDSLEGCGEAKGIEAESLQHKYNKTAPSSSVQVNESITTRPLSSAANSSFGVQRSSNSPTVAVVQPSVVRKSPPESSTVNSSNRPYNKNNYDYQQVEASSIYPPDSLEFTHNNTSSENTGDQKLDAASYSGKVSQNSSAMNYLSSPPYNGAIYQEATVGHVASGHVNPSYARPGYSDGLNHRNTDAYNVAAENSLHQTGAWITPSNSDINKVVHLNNGAVDNMNNDKYSLTNSKSVYKSNSTTNPVQNGYYLHGNESNSGAVPYHNGSQGINGGIVNGTYTSSNYTSKVPAATSVAYSFANGNNNMNSSVAKAGQDEIDATPFQYGSNNPIQRYDNQVPIDNYSSNQGEVQKITKYQSTDRVEDNYNNNAFFPTGGSYTISSDNGTRDLYNVPSVDNNATSNAATTQVTMSSNNAYNASAYSATGEPKTDGKHIPSSTVNNCASTVQQKPVSVQNMSTANATTVNNDNSNPTILPKYSVVYSSNNHISTSLNSRKPPVPAPRASTTNSQANTTTQNAFLNSQKITIPQRTTHQHTSGIPVPVTKPTPAVHDHSDASKIPRPKNPVNVNRDELNSNYKATVIAPSEDSSSDVESESKPEPLHKREVKGILKKASSATLPRRTDTFGIRGEGKNVSGPRRSNSAHARSSGIRDSVEVTKQQNNQKYKKRRKRKMVRFVDMTYTNDSETDDDDEEDEEEENENNPNEFSLSAQANNKDHIVTTKPPVRPYSAKIGATPNVNNNIKSNRTSTSATSNIQRKGPFFRPHPPSEPPTGRATMANNPHRGFETGTTLQATKTAADYPIIPQQQQIVPPNTSSKSPPKTLLYSSGHDYSNIGIGSPAYSTANGSNGTAENTAVAARLQNGNSVGGGALYDINGMRLDRTPTDEEINWLWDKVRNCLQREDSTVSSSSVATVPQRSNANQYNNVNRQSHSQQQYQAGGGNSNVVNTKYIDGNSLAPQFRTQTRVANTNNIPSYVNTTRKVSMDTLNTYSRKASLLNQRKMKEQQQGNISYHQQGVDVNRSVVQTSVKPLEYQPVQSMNTPAQVGTNGYQSNDVSESMAAFLTAEQLAAKSVSESEMEMAMHEAQSRQAALNAGKPSQKAPSALSIEEQRLMQSLERLNERLRVTDPPHVLPYDQSPSSVGVSNNNNNSQPSAPQLIPRPPSYHPGGFKGHAPLTNGTHPSKRFSNNTNTTVSHQRLRASSAGPPATRTNSTSYKLGYTNIRTPYF